MTISPNANSISPTFSGNFFFHSSGSKPLSPVQNAFLYSYQPVAETRLNYDDPESPVVGYAIHVEPEKDELVRQAIESNPDIELGSFQADDKINLEDPNQLQNWANSVHSAIIDTIGLGSAIDNFEALFDDLLDPIEEDDSNQ